MPPRPRTPVAPSRRLRVAGLRDPRRQDAPETAADDTTTSAAAPATAPAAPAAPAEPATARPAATPRRTDDPADGAPQTAPAEAPAPAGETTDASPATVDTTTTSPASGDREATTDTATPAGSTDTATPTGSTTTGSTTAATPTRAARPRPTGRADRSRRPAPSSGRAPRRDERRDRDRPRGQVGRVLASAGGRVRHFTRTRVAFPVTLVVVVLVAAAVATLAFLGGRAAYQDGPIANSAVVDAAATAEVVGASRQVIEQALSYDYTKLDDSVAAARTLGTGPFLAQYPQIYDTAVRPAAGQQQLRQTATVLNIGVRSIEGDRANVIVFAQFTLQRAGGQSATSAGLLDLTMAREDGRWKLFDFRPLTAAP